IEADVTFGSHRFNIDSFRLYNNENIVDCTPAELRLLREFIRNKGIVITRNQLLQRLYDTENTYIDDNTLSVYIKRLRDKLGEDAEHIKTVKGIGYRFE
ncbi:MAG: response regulator transcription factor, partial [Eubacterium sp.]|nr:response regulator transcription factor [Eubacterium sp.]